VYTWALLCKKRVGHRRRQSGAARFDGAARRGDPIGGIAAAQGKSNEVGAAAAGKEGEESL